MPLLDTVSVTLYDYDNSPSVVSFTVDQEATFAAQLTKLTALVDAISGITLGQERARFVTRMVREASTGPAPVDAQRGSKWVVRFRDITERFDLTPGSGLGDGEFNPAYGKQFSLEIPTADKQASLYNRQGYWTYDRVTDSPTEWSDFVTAFEADARSVTGGRVEIIEVYHANRNS